MRGFIILEEVMLLGVVVVVKELIGLTGLFWGCGDTELLLLVTGSNILCLLCSLLSLT